MSDTQIEAYATDTLTHIYIRYGGHAILRGSIWSRGTRCIALRRSPSERRVGAISDVLLKLKLLDGRIRRLSPA
jgi:hypothetical protein